ncbi:alpha/beta hydrolase [Siccirubricoccus sp. KC 17139]|uniref:Alpha/beta hydrolase n=1 Tax=Siccirubricoccus soli TaxID=2899147 RepID=A0ABT1D0X4_9PROT|nr:alpha/beta hydrolase [Siccirubricoccus soli]MCO6415552.1 alpha/beta hydrolase [Siccirubricoccus soli]MCP2681684.1 alpha/beta hydrolase [Siccirubricoccus soli]
MDAEAEYNNRARVPEHPVILAAWKAEAAAFRTAWPEAELDLAYGPGEREKLDLFRPGPGEGWPMALFFHGGYWQSLDRHWFSHMARGLLARGVAVAMPSYDLCPVVPLRVIVTQARAASAYLHRRSGRRLLAIGHSAGGHLAAMLLATEWRSLDPGLPADLVAAALPISGVFELEPLLPTSIATALRLTPEEARALSPRFLPPPGGAVHAVVGAVESAEFRRQNREFAAAWGGMAEELPGRNHFTVLEPLADPESGLARRAAAMALALG